MIRHSYYRPGLVASLVLLASCASTPPSQEAKEEVETPAPVTTQTREQTKEPPGILMRVMHARINTKSEEAEAVMRKLASCSKTYLESEHMVNKSKGYAIWYHDHESQEGMPVPIDDLVFPGGTSFTLSTHDEAPTAGEKAQVDLNPATADPLTLSALNELCLDLTKDSELYFRYTYSTGSETGQGATVLIKAEADFNPSTPELHTYTQEIFVDKNTWEVVVAPAFLEHEFE